MTEAEARAELEPLFSALVRWYVAYRAVMVRSTGKKPHLRPEILDVVMRAEKYERYHDRNWGPIASANVLEREMHK